MVSTRYATAAYQAAAMTVPPLQAVILLYDGALARIDAAARAGDAGDFGAQFDHAMRAIAILRGLMGALDLARGAEVGVRLHDAYQSNIRALFAHLGRRHDGTPFRNIARGLRTLRNAWADIAEPGRTSLAQAVPPAAVSPGSVHMSA